MICTIDRQFAESIAKVREEGKELLKSNRPLSYDYEILGLMGEMAFADFSGYEVDTSQRMDGDKGVDFVIDGYTIDVKTARKAYNLIVEVGKVKADFYVLASLVSQYEVELIGWETGREVSSSKTDEGKLFKNNVHNHFIKAVDLQPMWKLRDKLNL